MDSFTMQLDYELIDENDFKRIDLGLNQTIDSNIAGSDRALQLKRDSELLKQKYPAKNHARKVVAELGVNEGLIYLPGQTSGLWEDSDQDSTFRQRRYFYYITGANFADCAVTYDISSNHLILWVPFVDPRQILWFGKSPTTAQARRSYDVDDARYISELPQFLEKHVGSSTSVYALHPDQQPPLSSLKAQTTHIDTSSLLPAMDRARVVKDDYEIALCRRANDIASIAHRKVASSILKMDNESEIAGMFLGICASYGSVMPYNIIAGSGINASTLHYNSNNEPLEGRSSVVLDAGAEVNCYASDITRTLPLSGHFSPLAQGVNKIVQRMQKECIDGVRPGKIFRELHFLAGQIGLEGLYELGILQGDIDEIAEANTITAFFPHGLGHHIGLETHDVQGVRPLSVDKHLGLENGKREFISPEKLGEMKKASVAERAKLRPGMIVTVEPGLYFCREYLEGFFRDDPKHSKFINWELLERYYEVGGIRYEDCILVTENGYENLTTAPKGDELLDVINGRS